MTTPSFKIGQHQPLNKLLICLWFQIFNEEVSALYRHFLDP